MSADYRVIRVSREFTKLFGYGPKEAIGRHFGELLIPDESQEVQRFVDLLARGQRVEAEGLRQREDGTRRYVLFVHVPVSLPGGQIATCAIYRDITERKLVEENLKIFRSMIDQSRDAIEVLDPNTLRFLDCNKSAHQVLGYTREEFLSLSVDDIDPAMDPPRVARIVEGMGKSGLAIFESLHRRKDGSTFPVEVSVQVIRLERDYCLAVVRDITERKRAEGALRQAEEKYRSIFENAVEGIFQTTPDGRFITANPALARMLGYDSPDELLRSRTDIARQQYVDPERRSEFKRLLEEHGVVWEFEHQAYRKDGSKIWLSENVRVVRDEGGAVLYYEGFTEDITGRKRTEQHLRASEQRFTMFMENLPGMAWIKDMNGRYVYVNDAAAKAFRLSRSELYAKTDGDIFPRETAARFKDSDRLALGSETGIQTLETMEREDGIRYSIVRKFPILGLDGQKVMVGGVAFDVTERQRAEDALKESEESHRIIAETASDAIITIDEQSTILFVNSAAEQIFGYTPEEMLGRKLTVLMPEYLRHLHTAGMRRYAETGKKHISWKAVELPGLHKGGREIPLELSFGEFTRDGKHVFTGIARDITERRRADEQLRQSERQLAEAQHLARLGSWNWDIRRNILTWSDEVYRIFGVDPLVSDLAYDDTFMEFIHADDRALVRGVVEDSLKTREPFSFHYRVLRPDGEERVIHSRGRIASDEYGNPVRMFGTAQDVTERRRAEERLRATTEQLRALSARIHSAKEEEGARIAREIHDELGAALTSLRWDLESVDKIIAEAGDRPRLHQLRERIGAMLRLTETTIGAIRRISSELRPGVLDDLGLVAAIEWQAGQFQARTGIACRCDCSLENIDLGREQSTAVFRIFQEALTNILRHAQATMVDITAKAEAGEFVLKIVDNGRGITEDERMGVRSLGLLGMRERAHLIGGKININGVEGEGTVITLQVTLSG